ncbi:hypothetical protein QTP88_018030 [Uroleucon formosanum]
MIFSETAGFYGPIIYAGNGLSYDDALFTFFVLSYRNCSRPPPHSFCLRLRLNGKNVLIYYSKSCDDEH